MSQIVVEPRENPKKSSDLFRGSLESEPACATSGIKAKDKLEVATSSGGKGDAGEVASLLESIQKFFDTRDNCDENFLYAYHRKTVASIYIGAGLGIPTVASAVKALTERLKTSGFCFKHNNCPALRY